MSASAVAWPLDGDEARAAGLAHVTDVIDRIAKKDMVVVAGGTPAPLYRYTPAAADVVLSDATDPSLGIKYTCPGCDATVSVTSMNSKGNGALRRHLRLATHKAMLESKAYATDVHSPTPAMEGLYLATITGDCKPYFRLDKAQNKICCTQCRDTFSMNGKGLISNNYVRHATKHQRAAATASGTRTRNKRDFFAPRGQQTPSAATHPSKHARRDDSDSDASTTSRPEKCARLSPSSSASGPHTPTKPGKDAEVRRTAAPHTTEHHLRGVLANQPGPAQRSVVDMLQAQHSTSLTDVRGVVVGAPAPGSSRVGHLKCHGFYQRTFTVTFTMIGQTVVHEFDLDVLLHAAPKSVLGKDSRVLWNPNPYYFPQKALPSLSGTGTTGVGLPEDFEGLGTVFSKGCTGHFQANAIAKESNPHACHLCTNLTADVNVQAFLYQVCLSQRNPTTSLPARLDYLGYPALLTRARSLSQDKQKGRVVNLGANRRRIHAVVRYKKQAAEHGGLFLELGDFGITVKGMLKRMATKSPADIPPLLKHMVTNVGKTRVRTQQEMFSFLDALYTQFGKRMLKWLRLNACAPCPNGTLQYIRTVHELVPRGRPFTITTMDGRAVQDPEAERYYAWLAQTYARELQQLPTPVPVDRYIGAALQEDEARMEGGPVASLVSKHDKLGPNHVASLDGVCGLQDDGTAGVHKHCPGGHIHHIFRTADGSCSQELLAVLQKGVFGNQFRCLMQEPMHPKLKATPVLWHMTCMKFTYRDVVAQWVWCRHMHDKHLLDVIGPLWMQGSDGASNRRKAMILLGLAKKAKDAFGMTNKRFSSRLDICRYTGYYHKVEYGPHKGTYYVVIPLGQCFRHGFGKFINNAHSATRVMQMGVFGISILAHRLVLNAVLKHKRGETIIPGFVLDAAMYPRVTKRDLDRHDTMDKASCQRLFSLRVMHAFKAYAVAMKMAADDGELLNCGVYTAQVTYLKIVNWYTSVFFKPTIDTKERCFRAMYVIYMLNLWRDHIRIVGKGINLTLKEHFITGETYQDIELSLNDYVLAVCSARDTTWNGKKPSGVHPYLHGENALELFFASLATATAQHRVLKAAQVFDRLGSVLRARHVAADQTATVHGVRWPPHSYNSDFVPDEPACEGKTEEMIDASIEGIPTHECMLELKTRALLAAHKDCTRLKMKPEGLTTANKRAPKYKWWTSPTFSEEGVVDVSDMLTEEVLAEHNEGADYIVPTDVPIESDPTDPDQTAGSAEAAVQSALDEEDSDSSGDDADGPAAARPYGVPLAVRESTHTPAAVAAGRSPKILVKIGDSDQLVLVHVARFVSDWWKTQQYIPMPAPIGCTGSLAVHHVVSARPTPCTTPAASRKR